MMRSLFTAITGLDSHKTAMDVVGHNLANVNTVGYKKQRAFFEEMFAQKLAAGTAPTASRPGRNPVQVGLGVRVASIDTIYTQGSFETTGKSTDVAINGRGFFVVGYGDEEFYTRAGNFSFDSTGMLVDPNGYHVKGYRFNEETGDWEPVMSDIHIPPTDIMPPKQTDTLKLRMNLSSKATGATYETWSVGPFRNSSAATITASTASTLFMVDSCMAEDITTGDYIEITGTGHDGESISGRFYFNSKADLSAGVTLNSSTTLAAGETGALGPEVSSGITGYFIVVSAQNTDEAYKYLGMIIGPDDVGKTFTANLTVRPVATYEDLRMYLNWLYNHNSEDPKYIVKWEDGRIKIIDRTCGDSLMSIKMRFVDYGSSGSKMQLPDIVQEVEGKYADEHVVVTKIYDKYGGEHELKITYVKVQGEDDDDNGSFFSASATDDPNKRKDVWVFYSELDGHLLEVNGATGRVVFDSDGNPTIYYYYARYEGGGDKVGAFEPVSAIYTANVSQALQGIDICPEENCPVVLNVDIDGDGIMKVYSSNGTLQASYHIATLNEEGAALGIHLEEAYPDLFTSPVDILTRDERGNILITDLGGESRTMFIEQNGYPQGELVSLDIDDNGVVLANYTNGKTVPKYRLALAGFSNEQGLERVGDNLFKQTPASGNAFYGPPGTLGLGTVKSGVLEMSNVDIAEEFTKMIVVQRGFQANARVITTADQMLQDIIALKR